ncbi:MAG TPA: tetratricopeptide repeat protein [Vicinamibacterales bacterium]|jgi:tetratricopeptide (TPR) repeat protein
MYVKNWMAMVCAGTMLAGAAPVRSALAAQPPAPVAAVHTAALPPAGAVAAFKAGHYADAAELFERALESRGDDAVLYHWLSRCDLELGHDEQAVDHARQAVELDPNRSEYHRWLGRAYGALADRTRSFFTARKVKGEFEKAIELEPGNVAARRDAMEYYLEAPWIVGGDHDKARDEAKAIAALDPLEGALAHAACAEKDGHTAAAAAAYERALAMKPAEPDPYFEAAEFYARHKDAPKLRAVVAQAAAVAPDDPRLEHFRNVAEALERVE